MSKFEFSGLADLVSGDADVAVVLSQPLVRDVQQAMINAARMSEHPGDPNAERSIVELAAMVAARLATIKAVVSVVEGCNARIQELAASVAPKDAVEAPADASDEAEHEPEHEPEHKRARKAK